MARLKHLLSLKNISYVLLLGLYASSAFAYGAMPWESGICAVANSLSGTTATAVAVIAIVMCGLMLAFFELGGIFKTAMSVLIGISMAVLAKNWLQSFTGVSYGC